MTTRPSRPLVDDSVESPLVARFCALWRGTAVPSLEAFVAVEAAAARELAALVHVDQRERHARNRPLRAEEYFAAFPALRRDVELSLDIVYQEYALRGEAEPAAAYLARFPDLAEQLAIQFELDRLLDGAAGETAECGTSSWQAPYAAGMTIDGRYRLLEEVGEGGMACVWLAEQTQPVCRRVAIKVVKPGMDSRQVLARFEAERQALAMMEHPSIAKVLDGGVTALGHPYFAMEYVPGESITVYCDQHQLNVRERLALFVQCCQAVQHAHQRGIIHRDLKPSNILVCASDGPPVPKVIDFGLAKAMHRRLTQRTPCTTHDTFIGTPLYMSPEQARSNSVDVDTRSDVYSLGVILYELLAGSTPLEPCRLAQTGWQEMLRLIQEEEPAPPSARLWGSAALSTIAARRRLPPAQLYRAVRGDLDWIVVKSLEKDRDRRYETAMRLARDVERCLRDEAVEARPPAPGYRFRKFARRNKTMVLAVAAVALALVAGTAASVLQATRATRAERFAEAARAEEAAQRAIAEAQRREALEQRAVAEANYHRARAAVAQYFTIVSESTLLEVPGLQSLRKELLEAARRAYETFGQERTNDPALLADLAMTHLQLGQIHLALNETELGLSATRQGLKIVDELRGLGAREHLPKVAGFWRGKRWSQSRPAEPKDTMGAWLTLLRMEATWQALARDFPAETGFQVDLALVQGLMGALLSWNDRHAAGSEYFRRAIAIGDRLARQDPAAAEYRADLAIVKQLLADNLLLTGSPDEALQRTREALALSESLVVQHPGVAAYKATLAENLSSLGSQLAELSPRDAEQAFRRALDLGEELLRNYPGQRSFAETWINARAAWSRLEFANLKGNSQDIAGPLIASLEERIRGCPDDDYVCIQTVTALTDLTQARQFEAHPAQRLRLQEYALTLSTRLVAAHPDHTIYVRTLGHVAHGAGWMHRGAGHDDAARQALATAIGAFDALKFDQNGYFSQLGIECRLDLIELSRGTDRGADGDEIARCAVERAAALAARFPDNLDYRIVRARALATMAHRLASADRLAEAEPPFRQSLELLDGAMQGGTSSPFVRRHAAIALGNLAEGYACRADLALSEHLLRRKLFLHTGLSCEFPSDPGHRELVGHAHKYLGWILGERQQFAAARENYRQAADIFLQLATDAISERDDYYRNLQMHCLTEDNRLGALEQHEIEL